MNNKLTKFDKFLLAFLKAIYFFKRKKKQQP